ncbi:fertility inhibition protein FinO, partial [Klebsiella pneumoniae]
MAEEKRPVLSLKRKPAENSTTPAEATPAPGVVRRKKVVVVSSPPAWKAKKAKLEKVKQVAEAAARNTAPAP